jgi:hypothetical protein
MVYSYVLTFMTNSIAISWLSTQMYVYNSHSGIKAVIYILLFLKQENYRIYDFTPDGEFDGGTLWINQAVPPKYRPSDALLREHFRQCILANIRGAGERLDQMWDPEAEHDLQDVATWGTRVGGYSRLELEMAHRLNSLVA